MIELNTQLDPELPDIMGSESEIRDALTNLIFNAIDAMPAGGRIVLRTDVSANRDTEGVAVNQVCLEVSDTGMGMDEETRRRCLEPFFTTKGERGTGLGLAMVYGMAQRHAAGLDIESEVGRGTAMRLMFPVPAPGADDTARVPIAQAPSRSLRILVVDDDNGLLESLRDTLEADGHQVTAMHGGQAGIDAFLRAQQSDAPFEVVITDLGMPYVDGRKVAEAVRAAAPETSIVLLTGWGQRSFNDDERPAQVDHLLSKPPRLQELRKVLAQCCD
jgi:CheY-like chemotaxis protein